MTHPFEPLLIIGGLVVVMCGSVMLFADFMAKRRELGADEPQRGRS